MFLKNIWLVVFINNEYKIVEGYFNEIKDEDYGCIVLSAYCSELKEKLKFGIITIDIPEKEDFITILSRFTKVEDINCYDEDHGPYAFSTKAAAEKILEEING